MELSVKNIIYSAVGFLLVGVLTPIGMTQIVSANTTAWNSSVVTIFQVLLPILYIVGIAIGFILG
jgi:hypothetical protein